MELLQAADPLKTFFFSDHLQTEGFLNAVGLEEAGYLPYVFNIQEGS